MYANERGEEEFLTGLTGFTGWGRIVTTESTGERVGRGRRVREVGM
jgi:hypothetical protein